MCDQGLQLQVRNKQEQMGPRAQSFCFHANVWDNKSHRGSGVGVLGEEGNTEPRRGCSQKVLCQHSALIKILSVL